MTIEPIFMFTRRKSHALPRRNPAAPPAKNSTPRKTKMPAPIGVSR